jgi:hypothetical protein
LRDKRKRQLRNLRALFSNKGKKKKKKSPAKKTKRKIQAKRKPAPRRIIRKSKPAPKRKILARKPKAKPKPKSKGRFTTRLSISRWQSTRTTEIGDVFGRPVYFKRSHEEFIAPEYASVQWQVSIEDTAPNKVTTWYMDVKFRGEGREVLFTRTFLIPADYRREIEEDGDKVALEILRDYFEFQTSPLAGGVDLEDVEDMLITRFYSHHKGL